MHVLVGNFSKYTLALMVYAKQQALQDVAVVSVDTGWAATCWQQRVDFAKAWGQQNGFEWIRLHPAQDFASLILDRKDFPSARFQWCASLLKGMVILDWLDKVDPSAAATVMLPKTILLEPTLPEHIDESEVFGGRALWHPLIQHAEADIDFLAQSEFPIWQGPSLECAPCLHHSDVTRQQYADSSTLASIELKLKKTFPKFIPTEDDGLFSGYQRGCGNLFGCGL